MKYVYLGLEDDYFELIIGPQGKQFRMIGGLWWVAIVARYNDKFFSWSIGV